MKFNAVCAVILCSFFAAAMVGCGSDLESACKTDCHETIACADESGDAGGASEDVCVENCKDLAENMDQEDEVIDIVESCEDEKACDYVECVMDSGDDDDSSTA